MSEPLTEPAGRPATHLAAGSAVDQWWREVGTTVLLGTARRRVPSWPELLPIMITDGQPPAPEHLLLDATALGAAALRTGRRIEPADQPTAAPDDDRPEPPALARQLLDLILIQPPAGAQRRSALLLHWLGAAAATGHRIPHHRLPRLLELATAERRLRRPIAAVADQRGRWLAGLNPRWGWLADEADPSPSPAAVQPTEQDWARLSSAERVLVVRSLRRTGPAAARRLIVSSWGQDTARDRRAHLDELVTGLGPEDEPLLEQALDDRAAPVRERAAELLDGLPGSARAARMAARLRPLVRRSGLLGRNVEVGLPGPPDPAAERDGLGQPPPQRSARGWWLERLCAGAPLEIWRELTHADPATTVRRIEDADVRQGLRRATCARRDPQWAEALLTLGFDSALLPALPLPRRQQVVLAWLGTTTERPYAAAAVVNSLDPPWSADYSVALLARLRGSPIGTALVAGAMDALVAGLHPAALPDLEAWLAAPDLDHQLSGNLRMLLQFHSTRQSITEAFR